MAIRDYKGNAKPTTLSGGILATSTSFAIDDNTGWPTGGANGKFYVTFDPDGPLEETILASSQSAGTVSVLLADRGVDDTAPADHTAGTVVIHSYSATDAREANRHKFNTVDDDHTQYMLSAGGRHDLTARHSAGTVVPTAAAVAAAVGASATEGAGVNLARATHTHSFATGAPSSTGAANAAGASASFPHLDHVHAIGAGSIISTAAFDAATLPFVLNPTGTISMWGAAVAPTGWQLCDGSAISRTVAGLALFGVIGTTFGVGDGATTFNVPDLRQRFPMGKATSGTGSTLGGTGGLIDHVHALNTATSHARFAHTAAGSPISRMVVKTVASWTWNRGANNPGAFGDSGSTTEGLELAGNSDVANAPFQAVNFIIKL